MTASKREQPKASGTAGLEVLIVEAINSFFIIPKIAAVDNVVGPVARAPKTFIHWIPTIMHHPTTKHNHKHNLTLIVVETSKLMENKRS